MEEYMQKNSWDKIYFSKAFDFIHKTVTAIMMLDKNTKTMFFLLDGDTDFFEIVTRVLQGDTYMFIICLVNILWLSIDLIKENGFTLKRARNRQYLTEIVTDLDYADDLGLLANTPLHVKTLQHSLEQAAGVIVLNVDTNKTEFKEPSPL